MFHMKHFYLIGFFLAVPACLGYLAGVFLIFFIIRRTCPEILSSSDWMVLVSTIFPPSTFIAFFASSVSRETEDAKKAINVLGGKIVDTRTIQSDDESISGHVLLIIKKIKNTPARYPRQAGTARKNPIR